MKAKYFSIIVLFFFYSNLYSQWIDFDDETNQRITITNATGNDDINAVDDQEKDLAVGDFDNDSFMDLVVVRKTPFSTPGAKTDLLFMNRNGVLEDETNIYAPEFLTDATDSRDVICIDVNNDTWLDLFIISTFGDQPKLYINQGNDINGDWIGFDDESSTRLPNVTVNPVQFCAGTGGDLTGNGFNDLYMVNYSSGGLALDILFINDGTGNFTEETQTRMGDLRNSSFGTSVEFHDVDNDNDLDIVKNLGLNDIAPFNDKGVIALFNNGDGTFTNFFKLPGNASYMATGGDLNNDGMLDVYVVDDSADYVDVVTGFTVDQSLTVTQTSLATNRTDAFGGNVKMIDLDGDGDLDVGLSSVDTDLPPCETNANRRFIIFKNDGLHSGDLIHPYGATMNVWNLSTYDHDYIDINNDGFMDIILGTCNGYKVFMQKDPTLSIESLSLKETISIYPNPANDMLTLRNPKNKQLKELIIYDLTGRVIKKINLKDMVIEKNIDISNLAKAIYILKIKGDNEQVALRIIKN
jgi:hypothetical protein